MARPLPALLKQAACLEGASASTLKERDAKWCLDYARAGAMGHLGSGWSARRELPGVMCCGMVLAEGTVWERGLPLCGGLVNSRLSGWMGL